MKQLYDANGNLFSDTSRGITRIEYNDLNLPTAIYRGDGHRQTITYDGRGVKLSVTYATATTDVLLGNGTYRRYRTDFVRRYGAGRVVREDSVEMVMHPYGKLPRFFALARTANRTAFYLADARQKRSTFAKNLDELANARFGARRLQSHLPMWTTQDPCLEKYFPTGPYAYCAANPIRFTDPTGCASIIFQGKIIGNDGIDDGRILVIPDNNETKNTEGGESVPSAGYSPDVTKALINFVKEHSGDKDAFNDDEDVYNMLIEIDSSPSNAEGMLNEVSKDDGKGGSKENNNREYGGYITEKGIELEEAGPVTKPSEGASIDMYQDKDSFHSHPSGTTSTYRYRQQPSLADIYNLKSAKTKHYVFGRGNKTVYIYNKNGIITRMSESNFKKLYKLK